MSREICSVLFTYLVMLDIQSHVFISAQAVCDKDGERYILGDKINDNCNQCICVQISIDPVRYQFNCTDETCLIQTRIINAVNNGSYGWTASNYTQFWGMSQREGVRYKLGTFAPQYPVAGLNPIQVDNQRQLPLRFDAREKWINLIHPPLDQGNCGASWAFSTAGVASDRVAIETNGGITDMLSPQHLLSCSHGKDGDGCDGGHLDKAWNFLRHNGILRDKCYLYTSGNAMTAGKCFSKRTMSSRNFCDEFELYIHTTPAYRISSQETDIMVEIMSNGPVQALMRVGKDFFMYKSGVYRCSNIQSNRMERERYIGYHSIRIIGWGEETSENGEILKYWLCINSWGQQWGENGYFRIERRNVHCNIESFVIATHISILEIDVDEDPLDFLDILCAKGGACGSKRDYLEVYHEHQQRLTKKMKKRVVVTKRRRKILRNQ